MHKWYKHFYQNERRCLFKNHFRMESERERKKGIPRITWTDYIQNSLKAYKLDDAVALDRGKCKRTPKNIFIGRGISPLSGNS